MMVIDLNKRLSSAYTAAPSVHLGAEFEIDVAVLDEARAIGADFGSYSAGGSGTAVWAPPVPTLAVDVDLEKQDEYEVRVYNRENRVVAAIEIVSPSNKDRAEHRTAFATKCAALMQQGISVSIVDLVTLRAGNLYLEMLDLLGESDPSFSPDADLIYATASRYRRDGEHWKLESWAHPLKVGASLPTLPLWLASDLAVPLELEQTYEETCQILRIA
jgi:hypothetical protein